MNLSVKYLMPLVCAAVIFSASGCSGGGTSYLRQWREVGARQAPALSDADSSRISSETNILNQ